MQKPYSVAADSVKSAKWDELCATHHFTDADADALTLLCMWHAIAKQAMDELDSMNGQTVYQTDAGNLKSFPQINTLSTCSIRIAELEKQLGVTHERSEVERPQAATVLQIVQGRRAERANRAASA